MRYPITDGLDESEGYAYLVRVLHPDGFHCPNPPLLSPTQAPQDSSRRPRGDYRCQSCGAVFNVFTDTVWSGTHYDGVTSVRVLRGFAQGTPTLQLAEEQDTIHPEVETQTVPTPYFYTDESSAYKRVTDTGRGPATVCHAQRE